jgi:hypothetical protein
MMVQVHIGGVPHWVNWLNVLFIEPGSGAGHYGDPGSTIFFAKQSWLQVDEKPEDLALRANQVARQQPGLKAIVGGRAR